MVFNRPDILQQQIDCFNKYLQDDFEFNVVYDKSGSIGRRYARNDEIGTPFCITIDEQTTKDNTVTIRFRDTKAQKRVKIPKLKETLRKLISEEKLFNRL